MKKLTESGPPKSGKTTRLVQRANTLSNEGRQVVFHSVEHSAETLRMSYGLLSDVKVVEGDTHTEWVAYK